MKSRIVTCMAGMALLAMLAPSRLAAQTQYAVTTLGTQGGTFSAAISINNRGWISGYSYLPGDQTEVAVLWRNGKAHPLGTLGGPNSAVEWPNHNEKAVVGIAETSALDTLHEDWSCSYGGFFFPTVTGHICLGFVWQHGEMSPLPTLGGLNGYASGANDRGEVVGWAETALHDPTCVLPQVLQFQAVVWGPEQGEVRGLQGVDGDPDSAATAINNRGQVVGISGICENAVGDKSATHAVLWDHGQAIDLTSLGGNAWNTPTAINDQGQIVGFSENQSSAIHAFLWTRDHGMQDLGTLPGDSTSFAYAINNESLIVGQSIGPSGSRAVIWKNGKIIDLNSLVPAGTPALLFGNDVNDAGAITGEANDPSSGTAPAYVAVPTDKEEGESATLKSGVDVARPVIMPANIARLLGRR